MVEERKGKCTGDIVELSRERETIYGVNFSLFWSKNTTNQKKEKKKTPLDCLYSANKYRH